MINTICVAGGGTMGSGIALVAAQSGYKVLLFDVNEEVLKKAVVGIQNNIQILLSKKKISPQEAELTFNRIQFISEANKCIADFFIEAIVENATAKIELFNQFAAINNDQVIFASNTSSLSISDIQLHIINPERVGGMHFFNPAGIMKLVEVISGTQTSISTAQTIYQLCTAFGKTPVYCKDAPGFIVNRVVRHYYLEAMNLVESGLASIENVDAIMEASGFKMGPFKLMDLIGLDINFTVSKSIYEAFNNEERFKPAKMQEEKILKGELGKKTDKGFYNYSADKSV